jgi:hypothetical protein
MLSGNQIWKEAVSIVRQLLKGGSAMAYDNLNRTLWAEEPHLHSENGFEMVGEKFMDCFYWDEAPIQEVHDRAIQTAGFRFGTRTYWIGWDERSTPSIFP